MALYRDVIEVIRQRSLAHLESLYAWDIHFHSIQTAFRIFPAYLQSLYFQAIYTRPNERIAMPSVKQTRLLLDLSIRS